MQNMKVYGYTLLHRLGMGGMAEVWYAENKIHKPAAVKFLLPKYCSDSDVVSRFKTEAEVMVKLNHPNIRQVYDYDEVDGCPCIVMEYLEGADLSARMRRGERFSDEQLQKWWNQIADALNYTHAQGVVHRDIKPSNIFVTDHGDVKLLDFGIAKVRDGITSTATGAMMGTLMYMSPEQVRDSKHIDYKTDLYSLAVTFVHLLAGKAPYDRDTADDYEIRKNIVETSLGMTGVPADWQAFLQPYLAKKPEERPALTAFCTVDEATVYVQPAPAAPVSEETVVGSGSAASVLSSEETIVENTKVSVCEEDMVVDIPASQHQPQPRKRKVWPWIVAACAVLAVVGAIFLLPGGSATCNDKEKNPKSAASETAKPVQDGDTVVEQLKTNGTTPAVEASKPVREGNTVVDPPKTNETETAVEESKPVPAGYVDLGLSVYWKNSNEWNPSDDHGFYTYDEAEYRFGSHLPTKAQWDELVSRCTWTWTGSSYRVTGPNGNSIFLPAAGMRLCSGGVGSVGTDGNYWSSAPYDYGSGNAWFLHFDSSEVFVGNSNRCLGPSVRLVQGK